MSRTPILAVAALLAASAAAPAFADCQARASVPWTQAGSGYSADAVAHGPTCSTAVVMLVVRRPGGAVPWDAVDQKAPMPGNAPLWLDIRPAAAITALGAADSEAMRVALERWLGGQKRPRTTAELPPWPPANLSGSLLVDGVTWTTTVAPTRWNELRAAKRAMMFDLRAPSAANIFVVGDKELEEVGAVANAPVIAAAPLLPSPPRTKDCDAHEIVPWKQAGPGYAVEVFADGVECGNAAIAYVVRAPDGRPLHGDAVPGFANYLVREAITDKATMARQLRTWANVIDDSTTATLPEWTDTDPDGQMKRGDFTTGPAPDFDRADWNALRTAARPMLVYVPGIETAVILALMPDGRVAVVGQSGP